MIWCMFLAAVEGTLSKEEWNQSRGGAVVRFQGKDDGDHDGESWGGGEEWLGPGSALEVEP